MQSNYRLWPFVSLVLVCLLAMGGLSLLTSPSAEAVLPPRPSTEPPERDEPTPATAVAQIYLRVTPDDQPYWTVVQWQDAQGRWHDVTSWQGAVSHGEIRWWVNEKDFGKRPFRWAIYAPGGPVIDQGGGRFFYVGETGILAVSQPFDLPVRSGTTVSVYVNIPAR